MADDTTDETEDSTIEIENNSILPGFIAGSLLVKFIVILVLVLLLVGGVSAYTYTQTSSQLSEEVESEYTNVANQSALQIENWQQSRIGTTERLAGLGDMESGNLDQIEARINDEMERLPDDVIRLHYVNLDNAVILQSSNDAQVDQRLSNVEAPWVTSGVEYGSDDVFVSEPVVALQNSSVWYVSPVETEREGDIALVMQTNLDEFAGDLGTEEVDEFTQVVNPDGRTVAGSQRGTGLGAATSEFPAYLSEGVVPEFINRAINGESGFLENSQKRGLNDEDHVAAYAPVQGNDLVVVTHVPSSQAFSLRSTITQSLLVLVGAVLFGFLLIGFTFGRGTVNALSRLTTKAEELEGGNLDTDLSVKRSDEFGRLTAAFAGMRNSLRDRIQEAEHSRREAEIARTEAEQLAEYLQEKAEEYSEVMQEVSAGDLTQSMDIDKENEAMDQIASDFNNMVTELEKTVGQLQSFSGEVMDSGEFVLSSTENIRQAAEDVADSAQRISDDANQQQNRLQAVVTDIETVISAFEQLTREHPNLQVEEELEQLRTFKNELDEATATSDELLTETENVAGAAEEQAAELNEVSARADRLKRYAQPLGEIVNKFDTDEEHEFVFSTGPTESPTETGDD